MTENEKENDKPFIISYPTTKEISVEMLFSLMTSLIERSSKHIAKQQKCLSDMYNMMHGIACTIQKHSDEISPLVLEIMQMEITHVIDFEVMNELTDEFFELHNMLHMYLSLSPNPSPESDDE